MEHDNYNRHSHMSCTAALDSLQPIRVPGAWLTARSPPTISISASRICVVDGCDIVIVQRIGPPVLSQPVNTPESSNTSIKLNVRSSGQSCSLSSPLGRHLESPTAKLLESKAVRD